MRLWGCWRAAVCYGMQHNAVAVVKLLQDLWFNIQASRGGHLLVMWSRAPRWPSKRTLRHAHDARAHVHCAKLLIFRARTHQVLEGIAEIVHCKADIWVAGRRLCITGACIIQIDSSDSG